MIIRSIMMILQIIIPILISKHIINPKPMTWFMRMVPIRYTSEINYQNLKILFIVETYLNFARTILNEVK